MRNKQVVQIVLGAVVVTGSLMMGSRANADDTAQLKQEVQTLQDRVDQLESELANKQSANPVVVQGGNGYFDQWEDPFVQMMRMRERMDHSMRQAFADTGVFNPRMDMKQTDKEYIITMDIPGMDKDKINVEIKEGTLVISGERHSETQGNKYNQYYSQERSFGSFMQAIPLPKDVKADQIDAKYKNGVLTVTVARMKKEEKKSEEQRIMVK